MSARSAAVTSLLWLALVALSITLSALAAIHDTLPGDTAIMSWAQDLSFPGQTLADAVRFVSFTQLLLAGGGALALLLWIRRFRWEALIFAAGLIILPLLQSGIKQMVDRPRPGEELVALRASFSSPSFPSGHVMSAVYVYGFLLYVGLSFPIPPPARAALIAASTTILVLSGPANVWLGVHWPSDVLGGYAWAIALLLPVIVACQRLRRHA